VALGHIGGREYQDDDEDKDEGERQTPVTTARAPSHRRVKGSCFRSSKKDALELKSRGSL